MKKLFALMLALCLLCSCAMAEEETAVLNWSDVVNEQIEASGTFQQLSIPDIGTLIYWVPSNMAAVDVSQIQAEVPPVAVFASADENYTLTVYALTITGIEDYLTELQGKGASGFKNITVNGIDTVACESEEENMDILVIPVTETMVLVYFFTPLNGDDEWDEVKGVILSSIQVAQ